MRDDGCSCSFLSNHCLTINVSMSTGSTVFLSNIVFVLIQIIFLNMPQYLSLSYHWLGSTSIKLLSSWFFCRYFINIVQPFSSHLWSALNFKEADLIEFFLENFTTVCLNYILQDFIFDPLCKISFLPTFSMTLDFWRRTQLLFIFTV